MNGDTQWINCRNNTLVEINKWIQLLQSQNGDNSIRMRKSWHTEIPSIQGPWTPFTHKDPSLNLESFPNQLQSQPIDVDKSATEKLLELFEQQKIK